MKKDEILFDINQTSKKLGISRGVLLRELEHGKIKGNWRGKRIKFTQADIDEYKHNQIIDNSSWADDYKPKYLRKMKLNN